MASTRTSGLTLLSLTLWLLTFETATADLHFCDKLEDKNIVEEHYCRDLIKLITANNTGSAPMAFLGGVDNPKDPDISSTSKEKCLFQLTQHLTVQGCCSGWTGPDCDQPVCDPPCSNGGQCKEVETWATAQPKCECPAPFSGRGCEENLDSLKSGLRYCYNAQNCQGKLQDTNPKAISQCCVDGFSGSWGSQTSSTYGCTPCISTNNTVKVNNTLEYVTCVTTGDDGYRTFDSVRFTFSNICPVGLVVTPAIQVYTVTQCDTANKCTCSKTVIIFLTSANMTYTMSGNFLTKTDGMTTDTYDATTLEDNKPAVVDKIGGMIWRRDKDQDSIYLLLPALGFSLRLDVDGMLSLTVQKNSILIPVMAGICGNANGYSDDELTLQTDMGAQRLFDKYKNTNIPCGTGLTKCATPEASAKADEACKPLTTIMYRCHGYVNVNDYIDRCKASYCSSFTAGGVEAAKKAVCNVLSTYQKMCTLVTGEAYMWRSKTLCPKTCNPPYQFNGMITNKCPLTCGASFVSYTRSSCLSQPYGGCECPLGLARINNTCVSPENCQCQADNGRFYNNGEQVDSQDHCQTCICKDYGLWECQKSPDKCFASCSVLGNSIVKTFDGRTYKIQNYCGALTLVQSDTLTVKVSFFGSSTGDNGEIYNPSSVAVIYQGITSRLEISKTQSTIENGLTSQVYMRQIGTHFFAIDIKESGRIICSRDGTFILKLKTQIFKGKTVGACGTLDYNKDNDFMSPSNSEMNGGEFLKMYLDCRDAELVELSPTAQNPVCNDLNSVTLPTNSRTNMDSYKIRCNSAETLPAACNVLQSLAVDAELDFATAFPNAGSCIDTTCKRRSADLCNTNCADSVFAKNCVSQTISMCTCEAGESINKEGKCVRQNDCGCLDATNPDKLIAPNEVYMQGCKECVCNGSHLNCDSNCEEVICANNQVSKSKLLATSVDPTCARMICPKPFHAESQCLDITKSPNLCFCQEGYYQTQSGACTLHCPCYEGGKYYNHGERVESNCRSKICQDGSFVFESERPSDCTGSCVITGSSMKLKQFDTATLSDFSIKTRCEMTLLKTGNGIIVNIQAMNCGTSLSSCMNMITIYTPYLKDPIIMKSTNPGTVLVGNKEYKNNLGPNILLTITNYYLFIIIDGYVSVGWNGGLTCLIEVSSKAFNDTSGMCGNFNLDATDDRKGIDGLPKETTSKFAMSWIVNPSECTMEDDQEVGTNCEGSNRQSWARKACSPILEAEAFAPCRKHGREVSFYDNCVEQACNCDTGGDCECLCDAIAVFAAYCNEVGEPARWRHQRLCPMQCDDGSVYQACGPSCPESCGKSSNATSDICSSLTCLEGCFCPEGYIRSNLDSMENSRCIPKSECPCVDAKGREIFKDQVVTINCQECECLDGELECTGEPCKTQCNEDQYLCNDGRCIAIQLKCNGQYDCKDGGDEQSCEGEICEGFLCRNGQCVGNTTVCDKKMDCMDNSDEEKCDIECSEGEYKCSKSMYCIPLPFLCDGQVDCWYSEDEFNCKVCPQNETHCNVSHCIPKNFTCDGNDDCGDGSDETGCTIPTTTTPEECQYTLKTFTQAENGLSTKTTSSFGDNIFTNGGWTPTGGYGDIEFRVSSGVPSTLLEINFEVKGGNGTTVTITVETTDGNSVVEQRKITRDPYPFNGVYNSKFSVIKITASATISNLVFDVCYEPVEETTTPYETTTPEVVKCEEDSTELTDADFGLAQGVDSVFKPTSDPSHIEVDVKVKSNQVENTRIIDVLFKVFGVIKVSIAIFYDGGRTISDEVKLQDNIVKYEPVDQRNIQSINFLFEVDENVNSKATVEYLSTKGCIKVKNCTLGKCNGECLDKYSDLCLSPCPPRDCCKSLCLCSRPKLKSLTNKLYLFLPTCQVKKVK